MDPMARTYGKLVLDDSAKLWMSGLPVEKILEEERHISHVRTPANDNPNWSAIRDHTAGGLAEWLDGSGSDPRDSCRVGLRLV